MAKWILISGPPEDDDDIVDDPMTPEEFSSMRRSCRHRRIKRLLRNPWTIGIGTNFVGGLGYTLLIIVGTLIVNGWVQSWSSARHETHIPSTEQSHL